MARTRRGGAGSAADATPASVIAAAIRAAPGRSNPRRRIDLPPPDRSRAPRPRHVDADWRRGPRGIMAHRTGVLNPFPTEGTRVGVGALGRALALDLDGSRSGPAGDARPEGRHEQRTRRGRRSRARARPGARARHDVTSCERRDGAGLPDGMYAPAVWDASARRDR